MKITIEPTTQIIDYQGTRCRVWEGTTDSGARVHLFIPRVAVSNDEPAHVQEMFARELEEQKAPTVAWPARMF